MENTGICKKSLNNKPFINRLLAENKKLPHLIIMKKLFSAGLIFLIAFGNIKAQTSEIKIYAYSQEVSKGIKPQNEISENGQEIKTGSTSSLNYLLYFTNNKKTSVKINEVWINQKAYDFKTEEIIKTPVVIQNAVIKEEKELVPATKNKVMLITLTGLKKDSKPVNTLKSSLKNSELVIFYIINGKKLYKTIKKIEILKPVVAS